MNRVPQAGIFGKTQDTKELRVVYLQNYQSFTYTLSIRDEHENTISNIDLDLKNLISLARRAASKSGNILVRDDVARIMVNDFELFQDLEYEDFEGMISDDEYTALHEGEFMPDEEIIFQVWIDKHTAELDLQKAIKEP